MIEGPIQTNNNGLVFYFDTKEPKSFIGKPTTNLLSNPTNEVIGTTSEFVQYADLAPIFNTYGTSVTYSLSLDLKSKKAGSVYVYMQNGSWTKYSFVGQSVNADTVYKRFTFNGLTAAISTPTETQAILAFYGGYGSGVIAAIKNVQVEISPAATPFVNGSRSNTQGLLDLTGGSTIDLTNAGYNTSSEITFNGSSNYITTPTINLGNTFTISAWFNSSGVAGDTVIVGTDANGCDNWLGVYNGYLYGFVTQIADVNNFTFNGATALSNNQWYHASIVVNVNTVTLYLNGKQDYTTTTAFTIGAWNGVFSIGRRCPAVAQRFFNGKIETVSMYNRALSASEILRNFNSQRSRYSV